MSIGNWRCTVDFMWTDRKQDHFPPARSSDTNARTDLASAGKVSQLTVIGKAMTIKGTVKSDESLHVDGELEGKLDLPDHRLTIGTNGRVGADTTAREVEVLGTLNGDIVAAKKITIRKGGRLVGNLKTPAIVIEDGAYFKGRIEIVNPEERPQIVRPAQPTAVSTAVGH